MVLRLIPGRAADLVSLVICRHADYIYVLEGGKIMEGGK
jgi:hypothetical protein